MAVSDTPPDSGTEAKGKRGAAARARRGAGSTVERGFLRLVATVGIVGIGVVVGAILGSSNTQGWIIGLVVALVSIVLGWLLSNSRVLHRQR